jgi:hypothetical protein
MIIQVNAGNQNIFSPHNEPKNIPIIMPIVKKRHSKKRLPCSDIRYPSGMEHKLSRKWFNVSNWKINES